MSYEYLASIGSDVNIPLKQLFESPALPSSIEVMSAAQSQWQLRWRDAPKREQWPEDITVSRQSDGLWVSFHSGTAGDRQELLSWLAPKLQQIAGVRIEFEEQ